MNSSKNKKLLIQNIADIQNEYEIIDITTPKDKTEVGKIISALANSCVLNNKLSMYAKWNTKKKEQTTAETSFIENLKVDLLSEISLNAEFNLDFIEDGTQCYILEVKRARDSSVQCNGIEYIFSEQKKIVELNSDMRKVKEFWKNIDSIPFEIGIAMESVSFSELKNVLDLDKFYSLINKNYPSNNDNEIAKELVDNNIIKLQNSGMISITNVGALLLSKRIRQFSSVSGKSIRVVVYNSDSNIYDAENDITGSKGYAIGFEGLLNYISEQTPQKELITKTGIRKKSSIYPNIALREIIANMLVHQDFDNNDSKAFVEIFNNRIEFSNPGKPLVNIDRIIDSAPRSRNPIISSLMHKFGICEERGSGYDKIMTSIEESNLPAPKIEEIGATFKITLYAHKEYESLTLDEKIEALYYHSYLINYNENKCATLTSALKRFRLNHDYEESVKEAIMAAGENGKIEIVSSEKDELKFRPYLPE